MREWGEKQIMPSREEEEAKLAKFSLGNQARGLTLNSCHYFSQSLSARRKL